MNRLPSAQAKAAGDDAAQNLARAAAQREAGRDVGDVKQSAVQLGINRLVGVGRQIIADQLRHGLFEAGAQILHQ